MAVQPSSGKESYICCLYLRYLVCSGLAAVFDGLVWYGVKELKIY